MWGARFFSESTTTKIVQGANLLTFGATMLSIYQNPGAIAEYGMDGFVHAVTAYALRPDAGFIEGFGVSVLNIFRLGALWSAMTTDCSTAPTAVLALDVGFHLWNAVHCFFEHTDDKEKGHTAVPK